jgi:GDPmannose 4,6-dehydratase
LGNLDARRDWGHARDYVEAMWLMLQHDQPEDFVVATGIQYSVRDFINVAAKKLSLDILWNGTSLDEVGVDQRGKTIIRIDPKYFRPTEVETLLGDASKAHRVLGWKPKISFETLVAEMITEDLAAAERDTLTAQHGYKAYKHYE